MVYEKTQTGLTGFTMEELYVLIYCIKNTQINLDKSLRCLLNKIEIKLKEDLDSIELLSNLQ